MNIIFSIFIDIPEDKLDNPGWYENGVQVKTDKSLNTKNALYNNRVELERRQREYTESIHNPEGGETVEYRLLGNDSQYKDFCKYMRKYSMISEYDIINFYKHWAMRKFAQDYDNVCYLDFDVVPNTDENVFNIFDNSNFGVAHSNDLAAWGKNISATKYNTCIRNPSSKYWNTYAMLLEDGLEPENDVFNTGIMVAGYNVIQKLGYFHEFEKTLDLMTYLKKKKILYIHLIFNEYLIMTMKLYSYLVKKRNIGIDWLPKEWHYIVDQPKKQMVDTRAKLYHVINKKVEWVL